LVDLEPLLRTLEARVTTTIDRLKETRMPAIKTSMATEKRKEFLLRIVRPKLTAEISRKKAIVAKFLTTQALPYLREKKAKALSTIAPIIEKFKAKKALNDAALKIQRAYTRHLMERASEGDVAACTKMDIPLMQRIRKTSIRSLHRGHLDATFYRYLNYAKATRDIASMKKLAYAYLSVLGHGGYKPSEILLLANLFNFKIPHTASTIGVLMAYQFKELKDLLKHAIGNHGKKWADETSLANIHNPKGKMHEIYVYNPETKEDEKRKVPYVIADFNPWREKPGDTVIHFNHGGGYYHLLEFFSGISDGYALEGPSCAGNVYGFGIQVHPCEVERSRTEYYAIERTPVYFDEPCVIHGDVEAKYLQTATNYGYETGLRGEFAPHVRNVTYEVLTTDRNYVWVLDEIVARDLVKEGCRAAYEARYGEDSILSRVRPAITEFRGAAGAGRS
jgi:hypothetical protein